MKSARNFSAPYTSASLKQYIQNPSIQLSVCWKLTSRKGRVVAATSHTTDLVLPAHPNITFMSAQGVVSSAVDNELGLSSAGLEVDAVFIMRVLDEESVAKGDWDGALFEVFVVNPNAPQMGEYVMYSGFIGELKTYGQRFKAEGRPLSAKAGQEIGSVFTPKCNVIKLGDSRCKVNLEENAFDGLPITVEGVVTSSGSNVQFSDAGRLEPSNHFNYGIVEFTSGTLNGIQAEVKTYAGVPPGERSRIYTNSSWKFIGVSNENGVFNDAWKQINFDDTSWRPAVEQGLATSSAWGSINSLRNLPPGSQAQWIWSSNTVSETSLPFGGFRLARAPRVFRKKFTSRSSKGTLCIAGLVYTVYVNGQLIGSGEGWQSMKVFQLTNLNTDPEVGNVVVVYSRHDLTVQQQLDTFAFVGGIKNVIGVIVDLNTGQSVSSGSGGTFLLQNPLTREIPVGTTYKAIRGCDREFSTCRDAFGNINNFRGFPFVPGLEKVYKTKEQIS